MTRLPYVPPRPTRADQISDIASAVAGPLMVICGLFFVTVITLGFS